MRERKAVTRARAEMGRARGIMDRISELERAERRAWEMETSMTADPSAERVQSSGEHRPGESFSILSAEVAAQVRELHRVKTDILRLIAGVRDNTQAKILTAYYVNGDSFEQIAVRTGYCYRHVRRLHRQALEAVEVILEERDGKTCP